MDKLTNSMTLKKETVAGFIDRGSNFRTDGATTFIADRWVSEYFNVRPNEPEDQEKED